MPPTALGVDKYEDKRQEMASKLRKLAPKSDLLRKVAAKENRVDDKRCEIARKLFWEALDEYEEGEYSWEKFCREINKSLKAL
jgi:hypothetical protein